MAIFFLFFSFISIFGIFVFSSSEKEAVFTNLRLAFVKASLVVSLLAAIFIEFLSFFGVLSANYIAALWAATFLICLIIFVYAGKKNKGFLKKIHFKKTILILKNESFATKLILVLCLVAILSLACVAFTTNNNWDSYTYHLPRVEHWIQDKNVDFFPTNNIRQLYLAPFAEYFVLNLRLLSGSALFVNFVQFFAFLNCLILASLLAKIFGLSARWQLFSSVFVLTLPMGLLQATTTQTDLVVSFFLISFVYFGVLLIKEKRLSIDAIFFFGASFALGALTKSTFYIFALPFCVYFGICLIKVFKLKSLYIPVTLILMFLLLNISFFSRNYQQFGSIFGPQKTSPLYLASLNEKFGIKEMLSNSVKNVGIHMALPNVAYNQEIDAAVAKFHTLIDYPLNSPKTSWLGMEYETSFYIQQDTIGNFLHLILFFASLVIIFVKFRWSDKLTIFSALALVLGFFFFAFLLKWQSWQARLDLSGFVLMAPFVAYAFSLLKWKKTNIIASVVLLVVALGIVFIFDPVKPIFGKNSVFLKNNNSYIFDYQAAKKISQKLDEANVTDVGLVLGGDSWEWQYWLLSKKKRFENIYFSKNLTKTPNFDPDFRYKAVIINNINPKNQQISDFVKNKEDVLEISDINEKTTLVIYKKEQSKLLIY